MKRLLQRIKPILAAITASFLKLIRNKYFLYVCRWAALAIPGAAFLQLVQSIIPGVYVPMLISQAILGAGVYFIDRKILKGAK